MFTGKDLLPAWKARLESRIESARNELLESVGSSGALTPDEFRDLWSIEDYRGLIFDLGHALRLGTRTISFCEWAAAGLALVQCATRRWATQLWRHGGGHVAYVLAAGLEPAILLRRGFTAAVCSRLSIKLGLWRRQASCRVVLDFSNFAFWMIVHVAVASAVVTTIEWFRRWIWPRLASASRLFHSAASIVLLLGKLLAVRGTAYTAFRVTMALARRRCKLCSAFDHPEGSIEDPEPRRSMRVAHAILGLAPAGTEARRRSEELWVGVSPAGPLFSTAVEGDIMALWQRIDAMSGIDDETYDEILHTFQHPEEEILAAVARISRPPRPLLSAVIVATGLRMRLAHRLVRLRSRHLPRESSRWRFFGPACRLRTEPRNYVVMTALNNYAHQRPRILAGKLIARMLELFLGHDDGSRFHFVFVLPVCRQGTVGAEERRELDALVRATLGASYMPPTVTTSILDDLNTEVVLPNLKGLPMILALRKLCRTCAGDDVLALSEMNDSASWLNIPYMAAAALPSRSPVLVTGRRPVIGAGKPIAGHAATRLFNCMFRFLVPNVTCRDSSSVLKVATVASMREIVNDLTCLDYSIDQDILAMMTIRGCVVETPIEWYQARGRWGHERPASAQIASLMGLSRKAHLRRRLAALRPGEQLPFDSGFDFQAFTDGRGFVLKGYRPERNRLVLLLSALRSIIKPNASKEEGHREFARLIPLATRLIGVVGQGPLKAVLRLVEGRYRDPLPSIREHLKYDVAAIVRTRLVWRPFIGTPVGRVHAFVFGLEQPFAIFGTLQSAMEWNLRLNEVAGAVDTLRVILDLQELLASQGVLDPDLKSLLDCGVFIEGEAVVVRHIDFAGFLRDPYVIAAVLPGLMDKFRSMRDFRQIACSLNRTPDGRAGVIRFRRGLEAFVTSAPRILATQAKPNFSRFDGSDVVPTTESALRPAHEALVDQILATAKFAAHAPVGPCPAQVLMRQLSGYGSARLFTEQPEMSFPPPVRPACNIEPVFVASSRQVAEAIERAMADWLPDWRYEVVLSFPPHQLSVLKLLRNAAAKAGPPRIVMRFSGRSSRMRDMLRNGCFHKALLPVFGRPLFVYTLEAMRIPATRYPNRVWLTHPDTVCIWPQDTHWPNLDAEIVAPVPPEAFRLFEAYRRARSHDASKPEVVGKLIAREYLTLRTGGYSLPSLIGISPALASGLADDSALGGSFEGDFWGYLSRIAALSKRWRRGQIATPIPQTWFDIDEPSQLLALYRHGLIPGFERHFETAQLPWAFSKNSVNIGSTIAVVDGEKPIRLHNCVFDRSNVAIELDPRVPHAWIEGLVVANSNVRIRIAAPVVRDNFIYGVTTPAGTAVVLSLDNQLISPSSEGVPCAVPLPLRAFSVCGQSNEVLRCPVLPCSGPRRLLADPKEGIAGAWG